MANRVEIGGLKIDERLYRLVCDEIAPGTGVKGDGFWKSLSEIATDLGPKNRALLAKRDALQEQIDHWHQERKNQQFDVKEYTTFLKQIGYLVPEGKNFKITTANVDAEIAAQANRDERRHLLLSARVETARAHCARYVRSQGRRRTNAQ